LDYGAIDTRQTAHLALVDADWGSSSDEEIADIEELGDAMGPRARAIQKTRANPRKKMDPKKGTSRRRE
jgi:hypothetical protein